MNIALSLGMRIVKTVKQMGLYDKESYEIMTNLCNTISSLGLSIYGLSILEFIHVAPNHFAGACFKFYSKKDVWFLHSPYINNNKL